MTKPSYKATVKRLTIFGLPEIIEVWVDGVAIFESYLPERIESVTFHSRLNQEELSEFHFLMEKVNARISKSLNEERKVKGWGDQEENKSL